MSKSEPRVPAAAPVLPIPRRIGRFEVIDRLATGGMAEVFICCERGMAGLERLVVVKRILPHLAVHQTFVEMFLAEARWVARLNHPSVVQIYELGEDSSEHRGTQPYLAMEYVAGSSLRDVLIAAIEAGVATPAGAAVGVVAQACAGAHAAHELCDPAGKALGLVHRDISPHNLMATAEGHVKLLDFGIAKATEAADLEDHTRTGALKGKVHYMAPEQCRQEPLDRRADIFALGIVLWELLAQERLFKRDSDLDSMQAIVGGDLKDLSAIRPDVPELVVRAVEKALRADRTERYATADEMRKALLDACAAAQVRCDVDVVSAFVKPLIGDIHAKRSAELLSAAHERTLATPAPEPTDAATLVDKKPGRAIVEGAPVDGLGESQRTETISKTAPVRRRGGSEAKTKRRMPRAVAAVMSIVLCAAVVVTGRMVWRASKSGPPVVVGVPLTADRALLAEDLEPLRQHLEQAVDRPVELLLTDTYDDLLERFIVGGVSVAVLPPNTYVLARKRAPGIQLLAQKIIDGASGSDGVIFVVETSKVQEVAELRGTRFCFADPLSTTGYVLPRRALRKAGLDPDRDIVSHVSGNHTQVLRDIVSGVCEAGATYSGGYLAADRAGVPVARLRLLANTGRSPQDAVCASTTLAEADRDALRAALLSYDPRVAGAGARVERISGFAPAQDHDYDAIRDVVATP